VVAEMLTDEKTLICGMCGRRICDIGIIGDNVTLLRVSYHLGIPQQTPKWRGPRGLGSIQGQRPRDPNVRIFADNGQNRFRIVHEHKRNGRGTLDRTMTSATLERLYSAAVAADEREVVLR
jgi:hypothetical protein